ncbi:hypothetical protein cypCar_00042363 [Cyprinus carpio]|nr:hypothetical protein cypCar_00042363 [Cyprinus carpio]
MHGGFLQLLKKRKELIPLIGIVGCAALGATAASIYFLLTKPDVIQNQVILLDTLEHKVTKFRKCNATIDLNALCERWTLGGSRASWD